MRPRRLQGAPRRSCHRRREGLSTVCRLRRRPPAPPSAPLQRRCLQALSHYRRPALPFLSVRVRCRSGATRSSRRRCPLFRAYRGDSRGPRRSPCLSPRNRRRCILRRSGYRRKPPQVRLRQTFRCLRPPRRWPRFRLEAKESFCRNRSLPFPGLFRYSARQTPSPELWAYQWYPLPPLRCRHRHGCPLCLRKRKDRRWNPARHRARRRYCRMCMRANRERLPFLPPMNRRPSKEATHRFRS